MKMKIKVGVTSLNQTPFAWEENKKNILSAIGEANAKSIDILCLPELNITGYGCEDMFHARHVEDEAVSLVKKILDETSTLDVFFNLGLPLTMEGKKYNCNAFCHKGKILGIVPKKRLAKDGVHYESRWFAEWKKKEVEELDYPSLDNHMKTSTYFGDIIFELSEFGKGCRVGFETCEEAWVPDRIGIDLAKRDVDIILNPSASHFSFGKSEIRKDFIREGSRSFGTVYLYSNLLGNEAGRIIYDGDIFIANNGKIISSGKRFSYEKYQIINAKIDIDDLKQVRLLKNFEIDNEYVRNTTIRYSHMFCNSVGTNIDYVDVKMKKFEEFEQAVSLGLWDYMNKSHSNGFVVSLSGGYDSSAVAVLVRKMYDYSGSNKPFEEILTTVYQRTKNSSKKTEKAAKGLAKDIGSRHIVLDVDDIVENYTKKIERAINHKFTWESDNITLQNIQARVRSPSVWMIANKLNALLLTTSNRSEAAVGYATMDGDTSGGLNPIGGVSKCFLMQWLNYKVEEFESLKFVTQIKPTAELKPSSEKQTDEQDLMKYELLTKIEEMFISKKYGPDKILYCLEEMGYTIVEDDLINCINKFLRLWSINQWKRERFAISFHLDDLSLDPKTWCRCPILNQMFKVE